MEKIKINKQIFLLKLGGKSFLNLFGHLICYECGFRQSIPFQKGDFLEIEEEHSSDCSQKTKQK